ncbi:MAG: 3-oxoacyl-[acyl-carrier-protein] reductase [Eubacteriales bacterium]
MLTDKIAVVTGGSRGIGRAICVALSKAGATVVFSYAGNSAAADETVVLCGANCTAVQADVSVESQVADFLGDVVKSHGRIDILVNNAGITKDGLVMRMKESDFDAVIDTNLKGTFLTMKAVSKTMMKQRCGRIINISSVVALHGNPGQANYCASKAGVIGMSKAVAKEIAGRGVTVNVIAPGFIETAMTEKLPEDVRDTMSKSIPAGRFGSGEDIANAVLFLASDSAAYITGQVLAVDGGMSM